MAKRDLKGSALVSLLFISGLISLLLVSGPMGCGDDNDETTSSRNDADASVDRRVATPSLGPKPTPTTVPTPEPVDASCAVSTTADIVVPGTHVPEDTFPAYATNPPSSGPHYPRWANFQEYDHPVLDGYLVHSMEHGAVVLYYRCAMKDLCPDVAAALRAVRDQVATDPGCDPSIRVRVILVPRPDLDVPVAATAWGFTYKAQCVDAPSLSAFIRDHYAHATEDFCAPGITTF